MPAIELLRTCADAHIDAAAEIWAAATCARENDPDVPALSESRPLIEDALAASGSLLVVAIDSAARVLAFAAVQPAPDSDAATAKLRFVAVRPELWGQGVGAALMQALPAELASAGFRHARLSVYDDNERAIALYEHAGWRRSGATGIHPRSGRTERYYELSLRSSREPPR